MAKKKVYVSLDYKHDKYYKYLLESWDANPGFKFVFGDEPPDYIVPDKVHVLYKGQIIKSSGKELALEVETKGYDHIIKAL